MGDDWLVEFNISIPELRRTIENACPGPGRRYADDILGVVLLKLTRIIRDDPTKFTERKHIHRFAYTVAVNELKQQMGKGRRQREVDLSALADSVPAAIELNEVPSAAQLLDALGDVDPEIREVLRLHLEELKGREIATKLGISTPTVTRRLEFVRTVLKRNLGEQSDPGKE